MLVDSGQVTVLGYLLLLGVLVLLARTGYQRWTGCQPRRTQGRTHRCGGVGNGTLTSVRETTTQKTQRESLMRDLEREKMLRVDAEHRLHDMTIDSDNCKSRLQALQQDFKKMEEMVRSMMQYKGKIDILKQEKSNLTINYEMSMKKYQSHISNLEHENKLLLAEIKKLEGQPNNRLTDDADKSKLLLERLKRLESENSSLVLENEQQRQQYEKCLDDIANQVVQALMTQKSLREECMKLQKRVRDLEQQNRELNVMFQQRMRFTSDSFLQSLSNRKLQHSHSTCETHRSGTDGSFHSLPATSQPQSWGGPTTVSQSQLCQNKLSPRPLTGASETAYLDDSFESLQSMFSDYNDNAQFDESLGKPQLSSPPPWLRDKLFQTSSHTSEDGSVTGGGGGVVSQFIGPQEKAGGVGLNSPVSASVQQTVSASSAVAAKKDNTNPASSQTQKTVAKIETEFPVSNQSPKMTISLKNAEASNEKGKDLPEAPSCGLVKNDGHCEAECSSREAAAELTNLSSQDASLHTNSEKEVKCDISPGRELLKLSDSFNEKFLVHDGNGLPIIHNKMLEDSEDEDSLSSPRSKHISVASTVSLNELLERGLDDMETPVDDNFEIDNMPFFQTQDSKLDYLAHQQQGVTDSSESEPEEASPNRIKLAITPLPKEMCLEKCSAKNVQSSTSASAATNNAFLSNSNNNNNASVNTKPPLQRPSSLDINTPDEGKQCSTCSSSVDNDDGSPTPTNSVLCASSSMAEATAAACENYYSNKQETLQAAHAQPQPQPISSTPSKHSQITHSTGGQSHSQSSLLTQTPIKPDPQAQHSSIPPTNQPSREVQSCSGNSKINSSNEDIFPLFKKPLPPKLPPRRAPPKPPKPPALPPKTRSLERKYDSLSSMYSMVQNGVVFDDGPPPPLPPRQDLSKTDDHKHRKFLSSLSDVPPPPPPRPHRQKDSTKEQHPLRKCLSSSDQSEHQKSKQCNGETTNQSKGHEPAASGETSSRQSSVEEASVEKSKPVAVASENAANLSPDSAMQQSFSSTCSNGSDILSDTKPISSSRDDGYSSLSSDVQPEVMEKFAFIKKIPKLGHQQLQNLRCSVMVNGHGEDGVGGTPRARVEERACCESVSSNTSNSSIDSFNTTKVKDMHALFTSTRPPRVESQHHTLPKSKPCLIKYVSDNSDCQIQRQASMQGHPKVTMQPQGCRITQESTARSFDSLFSTRYLDIQNTALSSTTVKSGSGSAEPDSVMASSSETAVPYNHHSDTCILTPPKPVRRYRIKAASCGSRRNRAHPRVRMNWDASPVLQRSASEGYINNTAPSDSDTDADDALSTASTTRGHHKFYRKDGISNVKLVRRRRVATTKDSPGSHGNYAAQKDVGDVGSSAKGAKVTSRVVGNMDSCSAATDASPRPRQTCDLNTFLSSDSDSDLENSVGMNFLEMWKQRESPAMKLPEWDPKLTASALKKKQYPSPLTSRTLDNSGSSEQWLLNFSKTDISQQLNRSAGATSNMPQRAQTLPLCMSRQPSPGRQVPRTNVNSSHNSSVTESRFSNDSVMCTNGEVVSPRRAGNPSAGGRAILMQSSGKPATQNGGGMYPCPRSPFMGMSSVHRRRASDGDSNHSHKGVAMDRQNSAPQRMQGGTPLMGRVGEMDTVQPHLRGSIKTSPSRVNTSPHHRIHLSGTPQRQRGTACDGVNPNSSCHHGNIDDSGDFSQQIADLSRTVEGIHRSLTSLHSVGDYSITTDMAAGECCNDSIATTVTDVGGGNRYLAWLDESLEIPVGDSSVSKESVCCREDEGGSVIASDADNTIISVRQASNHDNSRKQSLPDNALKEERNKENCEKEKKDEGDEKFLDAEKRADILDEMVSGDRQEAETYGLDSDLAAKVNARKGKQDALRLSVSPRKTLDYNTFFQRFGEEEEQAISKFSFLDEMSSVATSDEDINSPVKEAQKVDMSPLIEAEGEVETAPPGEDKENEQDTVNGMVDFSMGDMMRALRLHPLKNRALDALKEEVRTDNNRFSTATFDQLTFGEDGISLSDSCCESFSSSNVSVNEFTIL